MTYVDKAFHVQLLPKDIANVLSDNGWENFLSYRYFHQSKYADVRLFRSFGSDGQWRHLGMAFGYDVENSIFADGRLISEGSQLGMLGIGDGINKMFYAKVFPFSEKYEIDVYLSGVKVNSNRLIINHRDGIIAFKVAPADGEIVTISYKLGETAAEPPNYLNFFTFDSVNLANFVGTDAPIKLEDGDGVRKGFQTPTFPIKANSIYLYVDGVLQIEGVDFEVDLTNGYITFTNPPALGKEITIRYTHIIAGVSLAPAGDGDGVNTEFYTPNAPIGTNSVKVYVDRVLQGDGTFEVDYETGTITLDTAPVLGAEVAIEYLDLTGGSPAGITHLQNDIKAERSIKVDSPMSVMDAVYRSLDYITPSLPTVHDFTSEKTFGGAWQRDSYIYLWGDINKNRGMIFTRPDPTGNPEVALFTPLYFGKIHTKGLSPRRNMFLASGCTSDREIKYKENQKIGGMNVDFGLRTSNGNRGVLLSQGLGGSYYQQHYLKFHTFSKYADNGDGRFNPSRWSKKYHFSQMKITHPNDGDIGYLDDVLAIHPKNIFQNDEVEVEEVVKNERLGLGDGLRRTFHLRHAAIEDTLVIKSNCQTISDYTYDPDTKAVTFTVAPGQTVEILADYEYSHLYQYNLPTAPISAFTLEEFSPYWPIGLGIIKDPQKPKREPVE